MKPTPRKLRSVVLVLALLSSVSRPFAARAAEAEPRVQVTGLLGLAQVSHQGGPFAPVKVGTELGPGDVLQTAERSAIDLSLGKSIGTVRLTQSSTLLLNAFAPGAAKPAKPAEIQLDLRTGELLGDIERLPDGSRFQIKTPAGIAGIVEGRFRQDTRGLLVVMEGTALFVEMKGDTDPVAHTLKAKKPIYFFPAEGIRPVPDALEDEVKGQFKAKLPKR